MTDTIRRAWLPYLEDDVPAGCLSCADVAAFELALGCRRLGVEAPETLIDPDMGEGYRIFREGGKAVVAGGRSGVLYGAYAFLEALVAGDAPPEGAQKPFYAFRMLNCWDNADGTVERGYSGRSLWF